MLSAGWCDGKDFRRLCVSETMLTWGTTILVDLSVFTKNLGISTGEVQMHFFLPEDLKCEGRLCTAILFFRQRCAWVRKMKRHLVSHSLAGSCVHSWVRAVRLHNKIHTGYLSRAISHVCRIQRLSSPRQCSKANCFLQPVNLSSIAAKLYVFVLCFPPLVYFFLNWPKFTRRNQIVLKGILR